MTQFRAFLSETKSIFYRRPKAEIGRLRRWGPRAYFRCDAWAREMEAAAWHLPTLGDRATDQTRPPIEVWFLTGRRFWFQTAFCAWTLACQSGRRIRLNLIDDGSLDDGHQQGLRRLFPDGLTITKQTVRERIENLLPENRFPILRRRWSDYVNIRKLIDIHLGAIGTRLVLDSDMLFFERPSALMAWWDQLVEADADDGGSCHYSPCLMTDSVESYGYSRELMQELAGAEIPRMLNVGICGLRSELLDWEELERWCQVLSAREGTSYYLEQALVAMIAARQTPVVMPAADYITFPNQEQACAGSGVLQHYVADSKPWYFGSAWKRAIQSCNLKSET